MLRWTGDNQFMSNQRVRKLTEGAILIALSTVLSLVSFQFWANGGAITLGSMLPIVFMAYRHGAKWGVLTAVANALVQLVLFGGTLQGNSLGVFVAAIFLDFIFAFGVLGLAGVFKRLPVGTAVSFTAGVALVIALRFVCHLLSGVLLWGSYVPEGVGAWAYSIVYNGSYMLPELLITVGGAFLLAMLPQTRSMLENRK